MAKKLDKVFVKPILVIAGGIAAIAALVYFGGPWVLSLFSGVE